MGTQPGGKAPDASANDPILSSHLAAVGSSLPLGGDAAGMMGSRDLMARSRLRAFSGARGFLVRFSWC